jgi:uncharacterized membrane protein
MYKAMIILKVLFILFIVSVVYCLYLSVIEQSAVLTTMNIVLLSVSILNCRELNRLMRLERLSEMMRERAIKEIEAV